MEISIMKKYNSLICGFAIKFLSIIALVCTVLGCTSYFFYYDHVKVLDKWWINKPIFQFPHLGTLIYLLMSLAPCVLWVIYLFKFHNEFKAPILVPIIFGIVPLKILLGHILMDVGSFDIVLSLSCIFAIISALKGLNNKFFVIIPMSLLLLSNIARMIMEIPTWEYYISESMTLYVFASPQIFIGSTLFYISMLLFGVKNKIPTVVASSPKKEKVRAEKINPEKELRLLNEMLERGVITEEEYQALRTDIISKI